VKANDLMNHLLMKKGLMVSINQPLGADLALEIAKDLDIDAEIVSFETAVELEAMEKSGTKGTTPRGPVITVMGHVDHGKTSLLDAIRETNVAAGEAGGITQHIGAYHVEKRGRKIVFLDTPRHEAFATKRQGIDDLLDMILLTADLLDLKATPELAARGVVLEARKEVGRGIVGTVLVQDGSMKIGDPFFSGSTYGRVRAMTDERGQRIKDAGPATPVQVTGFEDVPNAGDALQVLDDETQARMIGQLRQEKAREAAQQGSSRMSLDQLFQKMQAGTVKELNVILKGDVQGSVEVLNDTLRKLSTEQVKVNVIHASVGAISTNDVLLASASD